MFCITARCAGILYSKSVTLSMYVLLFNPLPYNLNSLDPDNVTPVKVPPVFYYIKHSKEHVSVLYSTLLRAAKGT